MQTRDEDLADRVLVDLFYRFPAGIEPPETIVRSAVEKSFDSRAGHWLSMGSADVVEPDVNSRQSRLEEILETSLRRAIGAGVDGSELRAVGGWLRLDLVLVPVRGQAGIVVQPHHLEMLNGLGGQLAVKYMGPH